MTNPDTTLPAQRRQRIVALCAKRRFVRVRDIARAVKASVPTVQRDLTELDTRGLVRRVRGGAMAVSASALPIPVAERTHRDVAAKRRIGRAAAALLDQPGIIFLGSGTTVLAMLDHLDAELHQQSQFVTNAYAAARRLAELDLAHLLLPGRLITEVEAVVGEHAVAMLARFNFDAAVLGFQGMDKTAGLTDADMSEALLKAEAIDRCRRVIGVADAGKWAQRAPACIADLDALDDLVTDKLPRGASTALRRAAVRLTTVKD